MKSTLTIVPASESGLVTRGTDPAYDRARELLDRDASDSRQALDTKCELAAEIMGLRARFLRDKSENLKKGQDSDFTRVKSEEGFVSKLQSELGIHPQKADRIVKTAEYVQRMRLVVDGRTVTYLTGTGKTKRQEQFTPTAEAIELAKASLDDVLEGEVSPSRAWAGLVGEGKRVAKTGVARAPVNHYRNCETAIIKLATSIEHYHDFSLEQRNHLDLIFGEVLDGNVMPENWRVMLQRAAARGGAR